MPQIGARHKISHQDAGNDEISVLGLSGLLGDSQTPLAHKTSHQDGGSDEISLAGLAGQVVFVPYNGKIADITHADTDKHTLALATPLSETRTIISISFRPERISGTGSFFVYPNEGAKGQGFAPNTWAADIVIASASQRLQYSLAVANDDWDIFCLGYCVLGV